LTELFFLGRIGLKIGNERKKMGRNREAILKVLEEHRDTIYMATACVGWAYSAPVHVASAWKPVTSTSWLSSRGNHLMPIWI